MSVQLGKSRCGRAAQFRLMVALAAMCLFGSADAHAQGRGGIQLAGDVLQYVLPGTGAGLSFTHRDWQGELQLAEAAGLNFAITTGLKFGVDERRPNGDPHSFPSGHTSTSFVGAEFIRKRFGWKLGLPAYAAAAFVGYSRVEAGKHYPHDVVAGAGIGVLSSFLFTRPYHGWRVQPTGSIAAGKSYGFTITRRW